MSAETVKCPQCHEDFARFDQPFAALAEHLWNRCVRSTDEDTYDEEYQEWYREDYFSNSQCWCGEKFLDTPGKFDAEDKLAEHLKNCGDLDTHYTLAKMGSMHRGG